MDLDQLERLCRLRDSGALSEAEFLNQKQLLHTTKTPASPSLSETVRSTRISTPALVLSGTCILIVLAIFRANYRSDDNAGTHLAAVTSSSSSNRAVGTATAQEREAYSRDLYDRPSGLSGESAARYEALPPEGQEYVDEQMALYDAACARSNVC